MIIPNLVFVCFSSGDLEKIELVVIKILLYFHYHVDSRFAWKYPFLSFSKFEAYLNSCLLIGSLGALEILSKNTSH
jgi:hypothetical protein